MSTYRHGRHELGQNFLTDSTVIDAVVGAVKNTHGPIVEIGAGDGALTLPLQQLNRPITAIEIDPTLAQKLRARTDPDITTVEVADFLRFSLPRTAHTIVGNLPFHQTTATLRRLLRAPGWTDAVLITQWEVARRRAGIGGATMMTAQWWPWFDFLVVQRVPASAFRPRPSVDGGLLTIVRRTEPLLSPSSATEYRTFVHAVFTGKGRGLDQILPKAVAPTERPEVRQWLRRQRFRTSTPLPKDLSADQWAELFRVSGAGRR